MVSDRRIFGERLRRHRERRGITLASISESTKISTWLFVGLENGDCSRWPAGLYSRAYLRAYAEAVGLNADDTMEDFAVVFNGKGTPDGEGWRPHRRTAAGRLRLVLAEEPPTVPERVASRVPAAAGDLLVASGLALIPYVLLDPAAWVPVATVLGYQTVARLVSDEPLVTWLYRRARTSMVRTERIVLPEHGVPDEEVTVGDAASTAA